MVKTTKVSVVSSLEVLCDKAPILPPLPIQSLTTPGYVRGQVPGQHLPDNGAVVGGTAKPRPLSQTLWKYCS